MRQQNQLKLKQSKRDATGLSRSKSKLTTLKRLLEQTRSKQKHHKRLQQIPCMRHQLYYKELKSLKLIGFAWTNRHHKTHYYILKKGSSAVGCVKHRRPSLLKRANQNKAALELLESDQFVVELRSVRVPANMKVRLDIEQSQLETE